MLAADLSPNTRTDPLYATTSGTSMATPAIAGAAALLLEGYRDRHGELPPVVRAWGSPRRRTRSSAPPS